MTQRAPKNTLLNIEKESFQATIFQVNTKFAPSAK